VKREGQAGFEPALAAMVEDIAIYDKIFLDFRSGEPSLRRRSVRSSYMTVMAREAHRAGLRHGGRSGAVEPLLSFICFTKAGSGQRKRSASTSSEGRRRLRHGRIIEVEAREGQTPFIEHNLQPASPQMGFREIFRQKGQPKPGQRRIQAGIAVVEDQLPADLDLISASPRRCNSQA
jgi:hypothetical protein